MTYRGKAICLCIVFSLLCWWLILLAVKMAIGLLMPVLVWMDK